MAFICRYVCVDVLSYIVLLTYDVFTYDMSKRITAHLLYHKDVMFQIDNVQYHKDATYRAHVDFENTF